MTISVKTKKQVEETKEIELPYFFKNCSSYYGIFDVDNCFSFYPGSTWASLSYGTMDHYQNYIADGEPIDEQEFRIEYIKNLEKFALPKRQITTADLVHE